MITVGSISREDIVGDFPFLRERYKGRRKAIKDFTHLAPDFVFWIFPDGKLFDAKDSHKRNTPKDYRHILEDEPDYCGFLRGRVASNHGPQIIVVYCRSEALANDKEKMTQFLLGYKQIPVPITDTTIVVSDNGDLYGTISDIRARCDRI
ncbi:MAG: hypothetical protein OEZ39_16235 [Gammaproteobacteria bacterium]|nr:hypothetical protein [Gammaproteobacteria bacterium]MDH5653408.1 hypothetical protein [Gammaproteobacteria bacterium]